MKKTTDERELVSFTPKRRTVYGIGAAALAAVMVWFAVGLLFLQTHVADASVPPEGEAAAAARAEDAFTGQWIIEPSRQANGLHLTLSYSNEKRGHGHSLTSFNIAPDS